MGGVIQAHPPPLTELPTEQWEYAKLQCGMENHTHNMECMSSKTGQDRAGRTETDKIQRGKRDAKAGRHAAAHEQKQQLSCCSSLLFPFFFFLYSCPLLFSCLPH